MAKDYIKPDSVKNKETITSESGGNEKRPAITFVMAFIAIIFSVGIIQAIIEFKKEERIQFFDLVTDSFVTPINRSKKVANEFKTFQKQLDTIVQVVNQYQKKPSGTVQYGDFDLVVEEAMYMTKDIKNSLIEINRHVEADTSMRKIQSVNQLRKAAEALYNAILEQKNIQHVTKLTDSLHQLANNQKQMFAAPDLIDYPVLWAEAIFQYTVFNEDYLRGYETEIEDESVAANLIRPNMQFFRYWFINDAGEKAIAGSNEWLYYKPGYQYIVKPKITDKRSVKVDPNDQPLTANPIKTIKKFQEELKKHGVDLLVVIVPGKASVYPDYIDPGFPLDSVCYFGNTISVMNKLKKQGVEVVDLLSPFRKLRMQTKDSDTTIYLMNDTHWKHLALKVAADEVVRRIKSYPWFKQGDYEYVSTPVEVTREGDVAAMTDLPNFNIRYLNLSFDQEKIISQKVYRIIRSDDETYESKFDFGSIPGSLKEMIIDKSSVKRIVPYKDEYRNTDILLLGDSFSRIYQTDMPRSAGWISHIAKGIGYPLATIVNDGGASTLVRETLARKKGLLKGKKLCIWEFVERDLRYGVKGWKDIDL